MIPLDPDVYTASAELAKSGSCVQAGVRHVVFSSLEDPRKHVPKGALPELASEPGRLVSHFETKAETEVRRRSARPTSARDKTPVLGKSV